jgi:hypothetical protein
MSAHSTQLRPIVQPQLALVRLAREDFPPVKAPWWEGCRFIGLASLGLWAGIWQIVSYIL